jgi:Protein of unknown function, DUF417
VLLLASPWSARAALVGSALAALTFLVTSSLFLVLPVWEEQAGGFPVLNILGQFLLKDVAFLGIALVIGAEALARMQQLKVRRSRASMSANADPPRAGTREWPGLAVIAIPLSALLDGFERPESRCATA